MTLPLGFIFAATPDPDTVTPGVVGFIAIFLVAVATVLLAFDMVRRIRRTTYRAEIQKRLADEVAARDEGKSEADDHPDTRAE